MLKAKIILVKTMGNIVLNNSGKVINPEEPIWHKDEDIGIAAFLLNRSETARLEITIHTDDAITGGLYILEGLYNQTIRMFFGSVIRKNNDPYLVFEVTAECEPDMFCQVTGDSLYWRLTCETTREISDLIFVPLEMYWLYDYDPEFFRWGVPVERLRELAHVCRLIGQIQPHPNSIKPDQLSMCHVPVISTKKWVMAAVVNYCFFKNPPCYDLYNKQNSFVIINNSFEITLLLNRFLNLRNLPETRCCCYDQAALLKYYLHIIGIHDISYCIISKRFSLKATNLFGWGNCWYTNKGEQFHFKTHAFCLFQEWDTVLDSCIGPHTGNETIMQYLDSINNTSTHTPNQVSVKNIKYYAGVTKIDWISKGKIDKIDQLIQEFKNKIGYEEEKNRNCPRSAVAVQWREHINEKAIKKNRWELIYEDLILGEGEVLKTYRFIINRALIHLEIHVFSILDERETELAAENRFLTLGALNLNLGITYKYEHNSLSPLTARRKLKKGNHIFWKAAANIIINAKILNSGRNLLKQTNEWINELNKFHSAYSTENISANLPHLNCEIDNPNPLVGQKVKVKIITDPLNKWDFIIKGRGIQLIEEKENTLLFKALVASNNTLILAAANPYNLLVKNEEITIRVK